MRTPMASKYPGVIAVNNPLAPGSGAFASVGIVSRDDMMRRVFVKLP